MIVYRPLQCGNLSLDMFAGHVYQQIDTKKPQKELREIRGEFRQTHAPLDHRTDCRTTNKVVQLYRLYRSQSQLVCISSETETMRAQLNNNNNSEPLYIIPTQSRGPAQLSSALPPGSQAFMVTVVRTRDTQCLRVAAARLPQQDDKLQSTVNLYI